MKRKSVKRINVIFLTLLAFSAVAATISINAAAYPYNTVPAAKGVGVSDDSAVRIAALFSLVGMYRTLNGVSSVKVGDIINVTYDDGSKEKGNVVCLAGSICVVPIPGTQQNASGGGGSVGDSGGGGGGSLSGGGLLGGCTNTCSTGTVTVGKLKPN